MMRQITKVYIQWPKKEEKGNNITPLLIKKKLQIKKMICTANYE